MVNFDNMSNRLFLKSLPILALIAVFFASTNARAAQVAPSCANAGNPCTSGANNCGDTNSGNIDPSTCECDAITPAGRSCGDNRIDLTATECPPFYNDDLEVDECVPDDIDICQTYPFLVGCSDDPNDHDGRSYMLYCPCGARIQLGEGKTEYCDSACNAIGGSDLRYPD